MKDHIFISYSRDQLYYAESVAHTLQKQNFNIWFDLQQLAPGTSWAAEIDAGLREASRVILIASRSSLKSPYVALEWMHALERHKPIYIVLFEEVEFKAFTTEFKGKTMLVPLDQLGLKAKVIIDGRGNFKKSVKRLGESLASTTKYKDPIPSVNRFKIPQRLPLPVAFIAGTMAVLTVLTLVLTFTVFSAFLPMMLVGCIATAYCGLQTWEFLQRKSYQGTRVVLAIAPVILYLFAFWFAPLAVIALCLAIFSDDVHRWSPRGEGNNPRDLVVKRKRPLWQQLLPFLILAPLFCLSPGVLWFSLILWFFVRNRNIYETHRRGDTIIALLILSTLLIFIEVILTLPVILVMTAIAYRRQQPIPGTGSTVEVTYQIHAQEEDVHIADDIRDALAYVGLKRLFFPQKDVNPDYHIVVISNFGSPPKIADLQARGGKVIVVLASSLTDWERVKEYGDYQWVDYRRQEPERLIAMARDLEAGRESNRFYTRIVPQSFERLVIPARVFLFLLVQLLLFNISIFEVTRGIVTGEPDNLVLLIVSVISLAVSFWIAAKILERRITVLRMTQINLGMVFAVNILALVMVLAQPLPPGYERVTGAILGWFLFNVILLFIFFRFGIYQVNTIMKWWLPPLLPEGQNRPNKQLTLITLVSGVVAILLTVSFFGSSIPVSHEKLLPNQIHYKHVPFVGSLSLDVPDHWLDIPGGVQDDEITTYILNVPISAVLVKANGPSSKNLAFKINSYFRSPYKESLIISYLYGLGEKIERTFDIISYALPGGNSGSPWQPEIYGYPLYTIVYVPDGEIENPLIMTIWSYTADPKIVPSIDSVLTDARTAPNTRPAQQSTLTPNITGFNSDVAVFQLREDPGKTVVVVALDTSDSDYYVTISGPERVLQENRLVLEHILESIAM
jgi:hypothetical protein